MDTNMTNSRKEALAARNPGAVRTRVRDLAEQIGTGPYLEHIMNIEHMDLTSKIAIEIPSFCDPDLIPTIKSALAHAANPRRLHFCVCLQDDDPERVEFVKNLPNCRYTIIAPQDAPGLCAARLACQQLLGDEPFSMHVDSHMRFADFWDVALIQAWHENPVEKSVISAYARSLPHDQVLVPPESHALTTQVPVHFCSVVTASYFDRNAMTFRCAGTAVVTKKKNLESAFIGGHFVFGPSAFDRDVPEDPDTWFVSDEASYAARLWTSGWRIFAPYVQCIYHLYHRNDIYTETPRFAKTYASSVLGSPKNVSERVHNQILFGEIGEPEYLGIYGAGKTRTIQEYMNFAGIDYKNRAIRMFNHKGEFTKYHETEDYAIWKKD